MNIANAVIAARDLFEASTCKTPVGIWEGPTTSTGTTFTCGYWDERDQPAILTIGEKGLRAEKNGSRAA